MVPDPYKTLGLASHDASLDQIKRAYRELARQYHPDKLIANNITNEDERKKAATAFAAISAAYALLTDPQRKAQYDHIYKYGGYDDHNTQDNQSKQRIHSNFKYRTTPTTTTTSTAPNTVASNTDSTNNNNANTNTASRKRKNSHSRHTSGVSGERDRQTTSIGYHCIDPLAFFWTNGRVQTKIAVAGIHIPSRLQMSQAYAATASGNTANAHTAGIRFAFSKGEVLNSPSGKRTYKRQTTHFTQGKKYTRTETTTIHTDGRREVLIEDDGGNDGSSCERRTWYPAAPSVAAATDSQQQQQGEDVANQDTSNEPWYAHAWHGLREKLTMCYNPCVVVAAQ